MHIKCSGFLKIFCGTSLFRGDCWFTPPHYINKQKSRGYWVLFSIKFSEAKGKFFPEFLPCPDSSQKKWMKTSFSKPRKPQWGSRPSQQAPVSTEKIGPQQFTPFGESYGKFCCICSTRATWRGFAHYSVRHLKSSKQYVNDSYQRSWMILLFPSFSIWVKIC